MNAAISGQESFIINTDASAIGFGALLMQMNEDNKMHPIHFASKSCLLAGSWIPHHGPRGLREMCLDCTIRSNEFIMGAKITVCREHQAVLAV